MNTNAVYVTLGVTVQGKKELLGLWVSETESAKFWLAVFTELHQRSAQDCFVASVDGLAGIQKPWRRSPPHTQVYL